MVEFIRGVCTSALGPYASFGWAFPMLCFQWMGVSNVMFLDGRFQCYVFSGCEWRQDCSSSFSGENLPASAESGTAAASKNTPDGNLPASVATGAAALQEPHMPWPCDEELEAMMDDAFEFS